MDKKINNVLHKTLTNFYIILFFYDCIYFAKKKKNQNKCITLYNLNCIMIKVIAFDTSGKFSIYFYCFGLYLFIK